MYKIEASKDALEQGCLIILQPTMLYTTSAGIPQAPEIAWRPATSMEVTTSYWTEPLALVLLAPPQRELVRRHKYLYRGVKQAMKTQSRSVTIVGRRS